MFVNVELKGPRTPELRNAYNSKLAALRLMEEVSAHEMHGRFLVSSFNHEDILE